VTLVENVQLNAPVASVWDLLVQSNRACELVPGLTPGANGRGTLRIMLGNHSVTYRGYARQHVEEPGRRLTWTMSGREVRGTGRAHAEVRARLKETGSGGSDLRLTVLVDGRGRWDEASEEVREHAVQAAVQRFCRSLEQSLKARVDTVQPPGPVEEPVEEPSGGELEIVPPTTPESDGRARMISYLLGGLLLGSLLAAIWRWRHHRLR
jgi:carbon monoxide dehydrogenase subunit G